MRARDRLAERGLADAGRADQREHGAAAPAADHAETAVGAPLAHGEVLDDALLHVVEAGVVGVEDRPGAGDVVGVLGALVPRQSRTVSSQVRIQPPSGDWSRGPLQLVDLLERGLADLLRQVGGLDAGPVVVGSSPSGLAVQLGAAPCGRRRAAGAAGTRAAASPCPPGRPCRSSRRRPARRGARASSSTASSSRATGSAVSSSSTFCSVVEEGRVAGVVGELRDVVDLLDRGRRPARRRACCSQLVARALYSLASSVDGAGQRVGHGLVELGALDPQRGAGAGGPGADPHAADGRG